MLPNHFGLFSTSPPHHHHHTTVSSQPSCYLLRALDTWETQISHLLNARAKLGRELNVASSSQFTGASASPAKRDEGKFEPNGVLNHLEAKKNPEDVPLFWNPRVQKIIKIKSHFLAHQCPWNISDLSPHPARMRRLLLPDKLFCKLSGPPVQSTVCNAKDKNLASPGHSSYCKEGEEGEQGGGREGENLEEGGWGERPLRIHAEKKKKHTHKTFLTSDILTRHRLERAIQVFPIPSAASYTESHQETFLSVQVKEAESSWAFGLSPSSEAVHLHAWVGSTQGSEIRSLPAPLRLSPPPHTNSWLCFEEPTVWS